jgi:hypothetical protein
MKSTGKVPAKIPAFLKKPELPELFLKKPELFLKYFLSMEIRPEKHFLSRQRFEFHVV